MPEHTYRVPDWIMECDCEVEAPWPAETDWEAVSRNAVTALLNVAPEFDNPRLSVSLLFTTDAEIRQLNREWRQRDKPTNVLSFPMLERGEVLALGEDGPPVLLGDVALAYETCVREADERGISLADHASHLIVHGLLHLAGYDHEISAAEAEAMEALETKTLAILGVGDPYCAPMA
jgi:probable rRNA maturation factor